MKKVGVIGATGAVGLEGIEALVGHPWLEVGPLYASERSAGKAFKDACKLDISRLPPNVSERVVKDIGAGADGIDAAFSALPSAEAKKIEPEFARYVPVLSTTSAFRYENDVPILITEINPEHIELLRTQQKERGWKGFVAPEPNCTTVGLTMSLKPLADQFGIARVIMCSYQAVSGGGQAAIELWGTQRGPGIPRPVSTELVSEPSLLFDGNVIGYIADEEPKVKKEVLKILGQYRNGAIEPAEFPIECFCVRVPTYVGHFEAVFVETVKNCSVEDAKSAYEHFNLVCRQRYGDLPSSPKKTVTVLDRSPQPRYDAELDGGMTTVVGRIEKCSFGDKWLKYQVLSNNLRKGAARGAVHVMEFLLSKGLL
ncbi:MAG: aspartate-semialdehyde dehydrogenase [Chloroflexi bacterium]|nr:aspartate-semialdehyde dehydrogenase [Chloroflexota bacterium]